MNSTDMSDSMPQTPTSGDLLRIERKVDRLAEAMEQLIRVEERQSNQGIRLGSLEKDLAATEAKLDAVDKKVDQWINRGIGVWAVAVSLWAFIQYAESHGWITLGVK